jgi:predicted transcriptional regulator
MKVLLSIKPQFADLIFNGKKRYEFRRTIFKRDDINKVIVYSSSPVCKVVGEFEIAEVITDSPRSLWKKTSSYAGISKDFFFGYFSNKITGHAIRVKNYTVYSSPLSIQEAFGINPPQSLAYIEV